MSKTTPEKFRQAYKKERDPKVVKRMAAVNMVCMRNKDIQETADDLMQCPNWVSFWVRRYREGGVDALRDLPRSGRPPKVDPKRIGRLVRRTDGITTPRQLRCDIRKEFDVTYHITNVRRIMTRLGLSGKTVQRIHADRAGLDVIRRWQKNASRRIARLKSRGFAVVVYDESIFVDDPARGVKYWSEKGTPVTVPYKGRHGKVVAYGALSTDGRQFFRTYDRFDKETVKRYLQELARHFGRVAVIMDNAPQHKAGTVREFTGNNPDVRIIWLPIATPELSAIEEYWHQAKRDVLVSEYYGTVGEMRRAMSEYFRTVRSDLNIMKFVKRKSICLKNF